MQFCNKHWQRLREEVSNKRMFNLVSKDGEHLVNRLKNESKGNSVVPDPLMEAHNMLLKRSIEQLGVYIIGIKDSGEHYCPLCEADSRLPNHPDTNLICSESWIITLIDYLHSEYKKEGWVNDN